MRKTKIICTLGPATDDEDVLRDLFYNGMNVARLNFSHGTHEEHQKRIDSFKKLRSELKFPVGLLLDTKGPEIRIKSFKNGNIELKEGQEFNFVSKDIVGDENNVSITYSNLSIPTYQFIGVYEIVLSALTVTEPFVGLL